MCLEGRKGVRRRPLVGSRLAAGLRRAAPEWERIGASAELVGWLKHGVPIRFAGAEPPKYDLGASLTDTTEDEKRFLETETRRLLELGAWEEINASEARCVNRVFLVPKAGSTTRTRP